MEALRGVSGDDGSGDGHAGTFEALWVDGWERRRRSAEMPLYCCTRRQVPTTAWHRQQTETTSEVPTEIQV